MTEVAIFFGGIAVGVTIMGWVLVFLNGAVAMATAFLLAIGCMVLAAIALLIEKGLRRLAERWRQTTIAEKGPETFVPDPRKWWNKVDTQQEAADYLDRRMEPPTLPLRRQPDEPLGPRSEPVTGRSTMDAGRARP